MITDLKIYKEVCYIRTFDWEEYEVAISLERLKNEMKKDEKFLDLWMTYLNKSAIKDIYSSKPDEIENFLLNIENRKLRWRIKNEVKIRKAEWKRINLEILQNITERCQNEVI